MRMGKSLMLGIAGSALIATGAMAADVMPVVVAAVPTPPPVATGPTVAIDVTAGLGFSTWDGLYAWGWLDGSVDVRSASGWGVRLDGGNYTTFVPGFWGDMGGTLTLYRAFGDLEVGLWAGGGFGYPCCGGGYGLGASFNYEHEGDRLYISSENSLQFYPYVDFYSYTEMEFDATDRLTLSGYLNFWDINDWYGGVGVDFDLTDKLEVWSNLYFNDNGFNYLEFGAEYNVTDRFSVWTWVGFDTSPFSFDWLEIGTTFDITDDLSIWTELDFDGGPLSLDYAEVWAELDHQIGTGPLSVIGGVGVGWDTGNGAYAWGNIGIRYKLGGAADRDDNRLFGN